MKRPQGKHSEAMGWLSFAVLLVSQLLATTAFMFVVPFMPLYVQQLGFEAIHLRLTLFVALRSSASRWLYKISKISKVDNNEFRTNLESIYRRTYAVALEAARRDLPYSPRCTTQLTKGFEIEFRVLLRENGMGRLELARA